MARTETAGTKRPCRACGMQLEFLLGPNGRVVPLQRVRQVYARESGATDRAVSFGSGELFVSHFETCPKASSFSRGQRRA